MTALPSVTNVTSFAVGPVVSIARPNNVVAYANGQVWGPAADARIAVAAPAAPADMLSGTGYSGLTVAAYITRNPADVLATMSAYLFRSQPATVLGDQQNFALSDADIDALYFMANSVGGQLIYSTSQANWLNTGAGVNGRRAATTSFSWRTGDMVAPGATVWLYIVASVYTPVALETLTLVPGWSYNARPVL